MAASQGDSTKTLHREDVCKKLRRFLNSEYKARYPADNREFKSINMPGRMAKVMSQGNTDDCGIFLLQYAEQFFKVSIDSNF